MDVYRTIVCGGCETRSTRSRGAILCVCAQSICNRREWGQSGQNNLLLGFTGSPKEERVGTQLQKMLPESVPVHPSASGRDFVRLFLPSL
eukprot:1371219-Amphidinium_carterae.1